MTWPLTRGQIILAEIGLGEPKRLVVVSNNRRNKNLAQVLAVRLTTSAKPSIPSIVTFGPTDGLNGCAVCDDIVEVYQDELIEVVGALTPATMKRIDDGLKAALGIS
jgi:mRNA interferase MazF